MAMANIKKGKRNDLQNTAEKDKYWASRTPLIKGMNSCAEGYAALPQ
jgi:hypothetical protein